MRLILTFQLMLIMSLSIQAQVYQSGSYDTGWFDQYVVDSDLITDSEEWYEMLSYYLINPFQPDVVNKEQLLSLVLFTEAEVDSFLIFRDKNKPLITPYELKFVNGLSIEKAQLLSMFLSFEKQSQLADKSEANRSKPKIKHQLIGSYGQTLQTKKGYKVIADTILEKYPNRQYLGEPFSHSLRYSMTSGDKWSVGFVAEKDQGEPFWNMHHKGYDFYSFHVMVKDLKCIKSIVVGDYKLSFGQGLVFGNSYSPSKTVMTTSQERLSKGIRKHFSATESGFYRGVATTLRLGSFDVSLFYSQKKLDGIVDSLGIKSFKKDGIHNIVREKNKKSVITHQLFGVNTQFVYKHIDIGLTAALNNFGKSNLIWDNKPYNVYKPRGNNLCNVAVNYRFKQRTYTLFGETSLLTKNGLATINGVFIKPVYNVEIQLLYRNYARNYYAFTLGSYVVNNTVSNEQGLYTGISLYPLRGLKLSGYIDLFYSPEMKYGVYTSSLGKEWMMLASYATMTNETVSFRYVRKTREQNIRSLESDDLLILPLARDKFRLQGVYGNKNNRWFRTTAEIVIAQSKDFSNNKGWAVSQNAGMGFLQNKLRIDGYLIYFNTKSYDARLSSYEKALPYTYGMTTMYGEGFRWSLNLGLKMNQYLSSSIKVSSTHYNDRSKIGSALEEIEGNTKTDIGAVVSLKF